MGECKVPGDHRSIENQIDTELCTGLSMYQISIQMTDVRPRVMANHYEVPNWAGKPPVGLHLDVLKGEKLIQKLMIDEKKCYLFGRNSQMNDFCIDHASCSRVHCALVWHKHLNRAFLVDLGSTHGTFIGTLRLEGYKPTQLPIDSSFHFGASTRNYIIRERPQTGMRPIIDEIEKAGEETEGGLLGLPETETELDNLTEFNTAHNRRISMLGISDDQDKRGNRKRKRQTVSFNEDEEIINPEDIDPSIGRFRNLIHTTVVPASAKRPKFVDNIGLSVTEFKVPKTLHHTTPDLYNDLPPEAHTNPSSSNMNIYSSLSSRLGMILPNPAPDVQMGQSFATPSPFVPQQVQTTDSLEPKKKKYAKEAWPGKKPIQTLLV
ncbi:nuclear inhibitor of protein phosphatase 1 isoform X2 [Aethina tumida]|uniref:nuclear inhibitor of protein phosphatase 1 isoform X2 n=1 Tax=Aethina tumida TaxID=116153 RepID=UPI00096B29AB|nr:nuclear inhibitor of protein phosphatase 1 isoform X2 [Aethina tumida]